MSSLEREMLDRLNGLDEKDPESVRQTIERLHYLSTRRRGDTTRAVDGLIQELFTVGEVTLPIGNDSINRHLIMVFERRLQIEHGLLVFPERKTDAATTAARVVPKLTVKDIRDVGRVYKLPSVLEERKVRLHILSEIQRLSKILKPDLGNGE